MAECTHHWQDCPEHNPDHGLPSLITVTDCLYGGLQTVDGDPWDTHDSEEVWDRVFKRILP